MKFSFKLIASLLLLLVLGTQEIAAQQLKQSLAEKYGCATYMDSEWYLVGESNWLGVCDAKGKLIIPPSKCSFIYKINEYYYVKQADYMGVYDENGHLLIPPTKYNEILCVHGWFRVAVGTRKGICTLQGEEVIAPRFTDIFYINGKFSVRQGDQEGLYTAQGKEIIPPCYTNIIKTSTGWYMVMQGDKKGICNLQGREVLPPKYSELFINEDHFAVEKDGRKGVYTLQGKEIIPPIYTSLYKDGDYYVAENENGKTRISWKDNVEMTQAAVNADDTETGAERHSVSSKDEPVQESWVISVPQEESVPKKREPTKAEQIMQVLQLMQQGYNNTNTQQTGRSRAAILYDLEKATRLLKDTERNSMNTSSGVTQMGYADLITRLQQRIRELEYELQYATY